MQYDKQVIDMYIMAYYLNSNNIYDVIGTNLNVINLFLTHHLPIQSNAESLKIKRQFHNFKLWFNGFISLALFWQSKSDIQLFWLEIAPLYLP